MLNFDTSAVAMVQPGPVLRFIYEVAGRYGNTLTHIFEPNPPLRAPPFLAFLRAPPALDLVGVCTCLSSP